MANGIRPGLIMHDIDDNTLRSFARVMSLALIFIFGLFLPWIWEYPWPVWPWVAAGLLMFTGMIRPALLRGFHDRWHRFAEVLGRFNSRIILGLIFFVLITPVAALLRILGKRPLAQKSREHDGSFCQPTTPRDKSHFEKPF